MCIRSILFYRVRNKTFKTFVSLLFVDKDALWSEKALGFVSSEKCMYIFKSLRGLVKNPVHWPQYKRALARVGLLSAK
jgi:hypothetical protein